MWVQLLLLFLAVGVVWFVILALRIKAASGKSTNRDADAALVLGAAVWNGEPSPVFRERLKHAIQLYHNKRVRMLLFTGGIGENDMVSEASIARQFAIGAGVPTDKIVIEEESRSTYQNLYYAREQMPFHQITSVVVVTDPLHMKRALMICDYLGIKASPSPRPRSNTQTSTDSFSFWMRETGAYAAFVLGCMFFLPEENPKRF